MDNKDVFKVLYNTVLSQTISSCGHFLFTGNKYGEISVFNIPKICNSAIHEIDPDHDIQLPRNRPTQVLKLAEHSCVYSLAFYANQLLVGTLATVSAYAFQKNSIDSKKKWEIKLSSAHTASPEPGEVNSIWVDHLNGHLYAACGDNIIYVIDLELETLLREFVGHTDYIHSVDGSAENRRVFTASEDGTVKFWDYREKKHTGELVPFKSGKLMRPELGKWQGTVSVTDDDWLVCGGGPRVSLWHLRSMECTTVFPFTGAAHVSGFMDDVVFVAGDQTHVHQYGLDGNVTAVIPTSSPSVYSIVWQTTPSRFMSIGGASNQLDISTNLKFKDLVVDIFEMPVEPLMD